MQPLKVHLQHAFDIRKSFQYICNIFLLYYVQRRPEMPLDATIVE